jgi:hypothetical protein
LKINFKTSLIFTFFGGNKNLGQSENLLRNGIPSFDSAPIFKMLKTLGNKNDLFDFLIIVAWTYPKLPIMLGNSQKKSELGTKDKKFSSKEWVLLNDMVITTCVF